MINDLEIVQWDYLLDPAFQLVNTAGKPLTNGWIEVYIHGTRDKYYCASDFNGTLHPFKIPLDSLGSNIVLASPANAYDVYIYNVYGSLVMSRYNVKPGSGSGSGVIPADASYGIFGTNELPMNNTSNTGFQFTAKDIGGDDITFHEITYPYGRIDCKEGVYFYSATIEVSNTSTSNESVKFQVLAGKNPNQSVYWLDFDNTYLHKQLYTICGIANFVNEDTFRINVSPYQLTNGVKASASQVAIHKLSTVVEGEGGGGGHEYGAGWGILINNDEISVDPSIIPTIEYVDASVSAVSSTLISTIESVSGNLQDQIDNIPAQVQSDWEQDDDTAVDYIKNKPDLTVYATHDEVCAVSSVLQNEIDNIDMSEYVTHTELNETVSAVSSVLENEIQIVSAAIPDVSDFVTHDEVSAVSSNLVEYVDNSIEEVNTTINNVSGDLVEYVDESVNNVSGDLIEYVDNSVNTASGNLVQYIDDSITEVNETIENVSGNIINEVNETINNVSGDLVEYIDNSVGAVSGDIIEYVDNSINNVSGVLESEIQIVSGAIPVVTGYATKDEVNTVSSTIIDTLEVVSGAIQDTIESVSGILQDEIDNIPEQVNADWDAVSGKAEILNKPDLSIYATHDEVNNVSGAIVEYVDNSVTAVSSVLNDKIDTVSGAIIHYQGASGVNVDGDTISLEDPLYIEAGDHIEFSQDGDNITISADVSDIEADIQVVSAAVDAISATVVSASGIEYGQFYSTGITTTPATMARVKGNITVDNGRIQLKKGNSYHVTVRGRYNQTTATNTNAAVGYIEYVSNNTINVNVDKTLTDSQYFEISYDLFNLSNNVDYLVWFTGTDGGTVNDLWIEIHSLNGLGVGQGGGTGPGTEYTAGYGIQILNNVISVSGIAPQVQSDWAQDDNTEIDFIKNKPEEQALVAGDNIDIQVSGSNVIISSTATGDVTETELATVSGTLHTEIQSVSSAIPEEMSLVAGNNITIQVSGASAIISSQGGGIEQVNSDWNAVSGVAEILNKPTEYDLIGGQNVTVTVSGTNVIIDSTATGDVTHADLETVSGALQTEIETVSASIPAELTGASGVKIEDDVASLDDPIFVKAGSGITITQDGDDIVISSTVTATPQVNADWTAVSGAAEILNKPNEYNLIAGTNVVITKEGNDVTISARDGGGGGSSYIAGTGIDITNDVISVSGVAMASAIDTVVSAIDVVSGKLPTTEIGKFTIQSNVSGGPIEVIIPTDVSPVSAFYNLNTQYEDSLSNRTGPSQYYYVFKSPGYDNDTWSANTGDVIQLKVKESIQGVNSILGFYTPNSNPASSNGPTINYPSYNPLVAGTGSVFTVEPGLYTTSLGSNPAGASYGKYITIMVAKAPQGTYVDDILDKIEFTIGKPNAALGTTVNLDRYYLGNTSTITNTSGYTQATIYTDTDSKKQTVYLPNSMPSNWTANYNMMQSLQYGTLYDYPTDSNYSTKQYRAYKYTSSPRRYQYAYCTDWDYANKVMTFIAYDDSGNAIEKWTLDYTTYGSNVWTTSPIASTQVNSDWDAVSGVAEILHKPDLSVYALASAVPEIELNNNNQVTAIDGHALATGGSSSNNYIKVITDSPQTSQVTFGDLRALCEGHAEFDLFYDATYAYRRYLYRCSHAYIDSTWCQVCFSTIPITRNDEIDSQTYGKQANKVYDLEFMFWSVRDDGPSDDTIVYVSSNSIPGAVNNNFAERSIQADWNETDSNAQTYIKNKPSIPEEINLIPGSGITIEVSGASAVISSTGGGGGSSYTAGDFIDITNNVISVDDTSNVVAGNGINITQSGNNTTISLGVTAGITDIQLVNSLPASPTSTVLYLIRET